MTTAIHASPPPTLVDWTSGEISGPGVEEAVKTLGQLQGIFLDTEAWRSIDPATEVYRVRFWKPVPDGTEGGLFWGCTVLQPGRVGDEYFMTFGHFHAIRNRAEFYATVKGSGAMVFMDEARNTWSQPMSPGSVHYIPGNVAHRVANTGSEPLVFLASWPSDAGHDYEQIRSAGFSKRLLMRDGKPCLV
ncbi:MAG: glucose-6-phosphate isomerase family protein [Acidobacteriota bacterium]